MLQFFRNATIREINMTTYHILNGDCLADQLKQTKINQEFVICRECLIDGDLKAKDSAGFWAVRGKFIAAAYKVSEETYFNDVVGEFEKLNTLPAHSEVCLWFGNDLFCQVNMWFVVSLLAHQPTISLYRVFPALADTFGTCKGFAKSGSRMLEEAYALRKKFSPQDIELGKDLWAAYKNNDFQKLQALSQVPSGCFRHLAEVCRAHADRFPEDKSLGRPDRVVKEIIDSGPADFQAVFSEFSKRESIYGFGDAQLKIIYDQQMLNH
jgi:hypothetical protein